MGVTVTKPQNVVSPNGNSLALYKNPNNGGYYTKDIYGKIEKFYPQGFGYDSTDVPFKVNATKDDSLQYDSVSDIIEISFTGVAGDFTLFLPLASDFPYRIIRIVNDQTVNASSKILITAINGETIDGSSAYTVNKAYNGIQVWSDGTQWIVIQAKG